MIPRLQEKYKGEIRKKLESLDKYSNVNQIPKIEKVIVHMGVCLLYTSPSPRDATLSRMPSSA